MSELSPAKQRAAWQVALGELTRAEIAAEAGVTERTLYEWLREEAFQSSVEDHCRQLLKELMAPAVRRLKRTINHGKPAEANKAIELAFRAAGWLGASEGDGQHGKKIPPGQQTGVIEIPALDPEPVPPDADDERGPADPSD